MSVWNPNIPLNDKNDLRKNKTKQYSKIRSSSASQLYKLRMAKSPAVDVAIKVLIICAVIDIPILCYFYFVKGVGFWEGIQQIRKNIHAEKEVVKVQEENQKVIPSVTVMPKPVYDNSFSVTKQTQPIVQQVEKEEPQNRRNTYRRDAIFSWTNESGRRVYSNTGFPKDKPYSDPKIEWR